MDGYENQALINLNLLREKGFRYLRTDNDGETWMGSNEVGVRIEDLIRGRFFRGEIIISVERQSARP
jgi:hypothetical protein